MINVIQHEIVKNNMNAPAPYQRNDFKQQQNRGGRGGQGGNNFRGGRGGYDGQQ